MTAQERVELGDLRKELNEGFKEIRGLHLDMIQRVARLEASAQTSQTGAQFRLVQIGLLISLAGTAWSIIHT